MAIASSLGDWNTDGQELADRAPKISEGGLAATCGKYSYANTKDELFKECITQNKDINDYDACKSCGLVKEGTPCKCNSCYSDDSIYFENLTCDKKEKCNVDNNFCYYQLFCSRINQPH